jgi:hypothetical protein
MGTAAEAQKTILRRMAEEYRAGSGPFPQRLAVGVLALGLVWEHLEATIAWSQRAVEAVEKWQKPGPGEAPMWPEGIFSKALRPKP